MVIQGKRGLVSGSKIKKLFLGRGLRRGLLSSTYPFPFSLSNLVQFLTPTVGLFQNSALTTPATADGDPIGGWQDQTTSANNATQGSASAKPLLKLAIQNGLPMVLADGSDDYLSCDAIGSLLSGSDKPFTWFGVIKLAATTFGKDVFGFGNSGTTSPFIQFGPGTGAWVSARRDDSLVDIDVTSSAVTIDTSAHVLILSFTGTTCSIYLDGTVIANAVAQDVGTLTLNTYTLFALRRTTVISNVNSYLGTNGIYSDAKNSADIGLIQAALKAQWATP